MITSKRFLSWVFLLGSASAYAMQPCTGPCDTPRPNFKCRKKVNASNVDTDTLLVRQNANVCGNLTVNGSINNIGLQLQLDAAVPPTDEVYTQYVQYPNAQNILENIEDFSIPNSLIVPGTEIYPDAPIYGYITTGSTQELVLGGGPDLSYNPDFTGVDYRFHSIDPDQLELCTFDNVRSWQEHTISYYRERGFPLPGSDVYPQWEGQFIFSDNLGDFPFPFVSIKFNYEDGPVPTALDLVVPTGPATFAALALYQPDPSLRKNGFYYPIRIPITTDISEYQTKFNTEPIAYYDNLHRRISIHVSDCYAPTQLSQLVLEIPCCNCEVDVNYKDSLAAFDGTFNLMRRNGANQLVSSDFANLEYLIQASSVVSATTIYEDAGGPFPFTYEFNFSQPGGVFTGLAIPLMNGAGPQADIFVTNGNTNAFVSTDDPLIIPALVDNNTQLFQAGDNPVTTLVENLAYSPRTTIRDTSNWNILITELPALVMEGLTTPEENGDIPAPIFASDPATILNVVTGHEYLHVAQYLQGTSPFMPTEANALGIEQDPKLNSNRFVGFRPAQWAHDYMPTVVRGDWPLTLSELAAPADTLLFPSTYGSSIFWRYMATQFDYNYQVMRRMSDILSNATINPLLAENGVPFALAAYGYGGQVGINPAGPLLALAQALNELHGRNVQDVFADYAVSLAMLRNNSSIPAPYRHQYPYWLSSPSYPFNEDLSLPFPEYATWWQDYQDNIVLPEGYAFPQYDGQTFIPTLDQDIDQYPMQDMTMLIFEVPQGTNFVDIHVTGQWRLAMVQFTSDDTPVGDFQMLGQFVNNGGQTLFDVSELTGTGPIRLVCAHVSMPTYQGLSSFCGEGEFTGTISITRS